MSIRWATSANINRNRRETLKTSKYLLNGYSSNDVRAFYSLRKLKSTSTYAIRVRRSSDDSEQDIGYSGKDLDTASLLAFVGSGSGFVVTWYDQSNNNNHATQTTAGNQPRIVNLGLIERDFDSRKCNILYPTFNSATTNTIITNGNFSNGTTGWSALASTISASNNTLLVTGNGDTNNPRAYQTVVPYVNGRRYFVRAKCKVTNSSCQNFELWISASGMTSQVFSFGTTPVINTTYEVSAVLGTVSGGSGDISIQVVHKYADSATANGKVMEVQEVVVIDVTALGEPTLYFDGASNCMQIENSATMDIKSSISMLTVSNTISPTGFGYIICRNYSDSATIQYGLISRNSPNFGVNLNGASRVDTTMPINTNIIISATWDGQNIKPFLNGEEKTNASYSGTLTSRQYTFIGCRSNSTTGLVQTTFFKGNIAEIILFSIALTNSQRQKIERNQGKHYQITTP